MNFLMFTGEALNIIIYYSWMREKSKEVNPFYFAIPATMDFIGSFLNFVGIIYLNASICQILKTMAMVFCIINSKIFLKKNYSIK